MENFKELNHAYGEGWLLNVLAEARQTHGPLPQDRLLNAMEVAVALVQGGLHQSLSPIHHPRGFARKQIVQAIKEEADASRR